MNFANFLYLKPELSLIALIVFLLIYDLFGSEKSLRYFQPVACLLFLIHTLFNFMPVESCDAFGGMYQASPMISIVKTILNIGTFIILLQADAWLKSDAIIIRRGEFYTILLSTLLGMYFMISAGNFLLFFIGIESASIPMAALAAFDKYNRKSMEAGAKYILSTAFASGISLYGVSLIYGTVGTLYFADVPAGITGSPIQILAFAFFIVGLFFKISLVPFHLWTADVYEGSPTPVTSYLSVISKGAASFTLMLLLIKVFGSMIYQWQSILYVIIIASITVANLFAIRQHNLKRFLAFSSISQAGYIMLGVISGSAIGMSSLVYYILVYMVSNLAAFGVIGVIEQQTGKVSIHHYNGLYAIHPRLSFVMMLALFSLAGIPPFAGFFSKFFIFAAAFEQGFHLLVFIALLNTIISLYYYLLVVKAMFINKSEETITGFTSDIPTRISLSICVLGIIVLGLAGSVYEHISLFAFGV